MKKTWVDPRIEVQQFVPNEYVAACITGTICCAVPGFSAYAVGDGTSWRDFDSDVYYGLSSNWDGPTIINDDRVHGICGAWADISFDSDTVSGYEKVDGVTDTTRPIYHINGYSETVGEYNVTWQSNDVTGTVYNHYGTLKISSIDGNPNAS